MKTNNFHLHHYTFFDPIQECRFIYQKKERPVFRPQPLEPMSVKGRRLKEAKEQAERQKQIYEKAQKIFKLFDKYKDNKNMSESIRNYNVHYKSLPVEFDARPLTFERKGEELIMYGLVGEPYMEVKIGELKIDKHNVIFLDTWSFKKPQRSDQLNAESFDKFMKELDKIEKAIENATGGAKEKAE